MEGAGVPRLKIAVLLSGSGRTLENLLQCRDAGDLPADIPVVISSRSQNRGVEIARAAGIETHVLTRKQAPARAERTQRTLEILARHDIDLIVMAGYLLQLDILPEWEGRIINIHPSLLPLFGGRGMYGNNVHAAVLESGMKVTGCTVHFVIQEYDAGPIILQRCIPVEDDDTVESLAARVFALECRLYPEAIRLIAAGRVVLDGQRTRILPVPAQER